MAPDRGVDLPAFAAASLRLVDFIAHGAVDVVYALGTTSVFCFVGDLVPTMIQGSFLADVALLVVLFCDFCVCQM